MTQIDRLEGLIGGIAVKAPCRVATTANITLSGAQTIAGILLVADAEPRERVLVKNQTNAVENGIYDVNSGAWDRSPDFDGARDAVDGTMVLVNEGSTPFAKIWYLSATNPIVIGTDELTFTASTETTLFSEPDSTELDHGVIGGSNTVKAAVDSIGTTNKAAIYLKHDSGDEFTDYVFSTNEMIPANILTIFEYGARIVPDNGITVIFAGGPNSIVCSPNQQVFAGDGTTPISFTIPGTITPQNFGAVSEDTANTYDATNGLAIQQLINSMPDEGLDVPVMGYFRSSSGFILPAIADQGLVFRGNSAKIGGKGYNQSIIQYTGGAGTFIDGDAADFSGVFKDIRFVGPTYPVTANTYCFKFADKQGRFENVEISQFATGMSVTGKTYYGKEDSLYITYCTYGLLLTGQMNGTTFHAPHISSCDYGIHSTDASVGFKIKGGWFENNNIYAVYAKDLRALDIEDVHFEGNGDGSVDANYGDIYVDGEHAYNTCKVTLRNNYFGVPHDGGDSDYVGTLKNVHTLISEGNKYFRDTAAGYVFTTTLAATADMSMQVLTQGDVIYNSKNGLIYPWSKRGIASTNTTGHPRIRYSNGEPIYEVINNLGDLIQLNNAISGRTPTFLYCSVPGAGSSVDELVLTGTITSGANYITLNTTTDEIPLGSYIKIYDTGSGDWHTFADGKQYARVINVRTTKLRVDLNTTATDDLAAELVYFQRATFFEMGLASQTHAATVASGAATSFTLDIHTGGMIFVYCTSSTAIGGIALFETSTPGMLRVGGGADFEVGAAGIYDGDDGNVDKVTLAINGTGAGATVYLENRIGSEKVFRIIVNNGY